MDKKLKLKRLKGKYLKILEHFCQCYQEATGDTSILKEFIRLLEKQLETPFVFEAYHQKIKSYYDFGMNFMRPLVNLEQSSLQGPIAQMEEIVHRGENIILLANHQTESDPFLISIMLEKEHKLLGEKIIYVAGERVITDPLAIPFSIGCDLLCIYSKRYIDHPPELKAKKQHHNKQTMERMSKLLEEGGKMIYVAPSGGRDRANEKGEIEVALFDPSSIEMLYLMAKKAKTPTHFYPLTLDTYQVLPPPESIQKELGEMRIACKSPIHVIFDQEFDMEKFPGFEENDKTVRRKARADAVWQIVNRNYQRVR